FGRVGEWFASHKFDISPDITVIGKGISGGYVPLAAVFCSDKIYNRIQELSGSFLHGFTFENTPFSTGVGYEVLKIMKKLKCIENSKEMGVRLKKGLISELSLHKNVGDIRGTGLFCAVEIVEDKDKKLPFERKLQISEKIVTFGMEIGINLYFATGFMPNGYGDAILFAPPLIVKPDEIDEIGELGAKAIKGILNSK
ncbi:MAG: aminotransferase class III-fold pyridoxal phosphate-dependent enzyme, partial [Thermodesulfovibrionales bacterium]|nr:aminotransferase class III-fold pyridoxal phosphate-dependent enzyme [Thermodesulfovibrionales bacterium]